MVDRKLNGKRTSTPWGGEGNENMLVTANFLGEGRVREHDDAALGGGLLLGLDTGLLRDESREALEVTAAVVVARLIALAIEPLEGWKALNTEALSEISLGVGVDLGDLDLVICKLENVGQVLIDGGESLAVAAPRGEELDESRLARLQDDGVEVVWQEIEDCRLG